MRPEKADAIFRRAGAWAKLCATLDRLRPEQVNIITAVSTENYDEVEEILDWAAARGIPGISVINVFKDPTSPARFRDDCRDYTHRAVDGRPALRAPGGQAPRVRRPHGDPYHPVPRLRRRGVRRRPLGPLHRRPRPASPVHAHRQHGVAAAGARHGHRRGDGHVRPGDRRRAGVVVRALLRGAGRRPELAGGVARAGADRRRDAALRPLRLPQHRHPGDGAGPPADDERGRSWSGTPRSPPISSTAAPCSRSTPAPSPRPTTRSGAGSRPDPTGRSSTCGACRAGFMLDDLARAFARRPGTCGTSCRTSSSAAHYQALGALKFCLPDTLRPRLLALLDEPALVDALLSPDGPTLWSEIKARELALARLRLRGPAERYRRRLEQHRRDYGYLGAEDVDFREHETVDAIDARIAAMSAGAKAERRRLNQALAADRARKAHARRQFAERLDAGDVATLVSQVLLARALTRPRGPQPPGQDAVAARPARPGRAHRPGYRTRRSRRARRRGRVAPAGATVHLKGLRGAGNGRENGQSPARAGAHPGLRRLRPVRSLRPEHGPHRRVRRPARGAAHHPQHRLDAGQRLPLPVHALLQHERPPEGGGHDGRR